MWEPKLGKREGGHERGEREVGGLEDGLEVLIMYGMTSQVVGGQGGGGGQYHSNEKAQMKGQGCLYGYRSHQVS